MDAISEEETRMGHGDSPPVSSQHPVAVRDTPHTVTDTPHIVSMDTEILVILGCRGLGWMEMEGLQCNMDYGGTELLRPQPAGRGVE